MYRRRSFKRKPRATWSYANSELLNVNQAGQFSYTWLLPAGRVNWLCDTNRVDHITFDGSLVWLDFWWRNTNNSITGLPDCTLFAVVTEQELGGEPADIGELSPFTVPATPSTVTSWESDPQYDGTDGYLWAHHIKGMSPPNAIVQTQGLSNGSVFNQSDRVAIAPGGTDDPSFVCRKFFVAAEWQPDLHIRAKRRLKKDEGVALILFSDFAIPAGVDVFLEARYRTLVNRGR